MKKIFSIFIIFLFIFGLFPCAFAMETKTIDIDSFDEFSIEQIQNTFSDSLSKEQTSNNNSEQDTKDFLLCNWTDYSISSFILTSLKRSIATFLCYNFDIYNLNYLYQYHLFDRQKMVRGISEYKIMQNEYIAVALFDVVNFVYI